MTKKAALLVFVVVYFTALSILAATTPITPDEADRFFQQEFSISSFLMHMGQNTLPGELGFRSPFLMLSMLNAYIFYLISKHLFDREVDRFLSLVVYLLLPGVVASTVLSSDALIISFVVLLFILLYLKQHILLSILVVSLLIIIHWSASFLYLSLAIYALLKRDKYLFFGCIILLGIYLFAGISIPDESSKSYFFELLGIYATVMSPLVFIYLFYSLYRSLLRGERDIVWAVSFISLMLSLLFSLGEKVRIVDFSPYLMIGVLVAVRTYQSSLRVRLRQFQKGYRISFAFVLFALVLNTLMLLFHQPIYRFAGKENYKIVKPVYEPYDLVKKFYQKGLKCTENIDRKSYNQMRYYGIKKCS